MARRSRFATVSAFDTISESLPPLGIAPTASAESGQTYSRSTGTPPPERIGEYLVTRCIGVGGMGQVFEAHRIVDHHTTKRVAIKIPIPDRLDKAEAMERAAQELCAMVQLRHPGIVTALDWGALDSGIPYIVMEFLDGELLLDRLQRLRKQGQLMPIGDALCFVRQIASAMDAVHAASIVHRDLKPGNVMIVPDPDLPLGERVKVMDFGLAKIITDGGSVLTMDGIGVGTLHYMAPEQAKGGAITAKSDVYSLGIILNQLLYPRSLSRIEPSLHRLVDSMVSDEPATRPTMREVMDKIDRIDAGLASARRRKLFGAGGLAAMSVALYAAGSLAAYDLSRPVVRVEELSQCARVHLEPVDQGSDGTLPGLAWKTFTRGNTPLLSVIDDRAGAALKVQRALWVYVIAGTAGQMPRGTCSMLCCLLDDHAQGGILRMGLRDIPQATLVEQRTLLGISDGSCRIKVHAGPWQVVVVEQLTVPPCVILKQPVPLFLRGEQPAGQPIEAEAVK